MSKALTKRNTRGSDSYMSESDLPETLQDVLDNQDLRKEFMAYLKARLANESLLFYESIEIYENIQDDALRQKAGKKMVQEFVVEDSECWVNVSAALRIELTETKKFTPETFNAAKREVFSLMSGNFLDSFRKHLQGIETESAPKLSFDGSFPAHLRSLSFEQLADALGENLMQEGDSNKDSQSVTGSIATTCSCKNKGCPSSEGEMCCEKAKLFARVKALKNKKFKMANGLTTTIQRRLSTHKSSGSLSRLGMFKLFNRRPSTTRGLKMWKDLEENASNDI